MMFSISAVIAVPEIPVNRVTTVGGRNARIPADWAKFPPIPMAVARDTTVKFLLLFLSKPMILIPLAMILPKFTNRIPPRTGLGIRARIWENFGNTAIRAKMIPAIAVTHLEATPDITATPEFCAATQVGRQLNLSLIHI